jgi:hypothetical protein
MKDLDRALADITAIRTQMARGTVFRGYGPATMAATGVLAILGALIQAAWIPEPDTKVLRYLALWVGVAAFSVTLIGAEMVARTRRIHSGYADEMLFNAVEQFMPAAVAGAVMTVVLWRTAPQTLWMIPGLWQVIFSLGIFASCRSLPPAMFWAAVWYLVAGLVTLALTSDAYAFSPYAMAIPFGIGQLYIAFVLFSSVEADDGEE